MMNRVFELAVPALPLFGDSRQFPVRRIYCVGRNYAAHAREMGASGREPPFFFAKPANATVPVAAGDEGTVPYPPQTADLQPEIELVAAIGVAGRNIGVAAANACIYGYAIGLDMTRRDLQAGFKARGLPWTMAKGFDASAPLGPIHLAAEIGHPGAGTITLTVNGGERQRGDLADMIWSVPEIIANLSTYVELCPGDLVFTGTPAGVGPVVAGDRLLGEIAGLAPLRLRVA